MKPWHCGYLPANHRIKTGERNYRLAMRAVVPFVNLTGDPQQEHFCRGIGASIQEHLMARDLTVFSVHLPPIDWFSCDFVQQARDLGVEKIVTGGVRETESMVRVH